MYRVAQKRYWSLYRSVYRVSQNDACFSEGGSFYISRVQSDSKSLVTTIQSGSKHFPTHLASYRVTQNVAWALVMEVSLTVQSDSKKLPHAFSFVQGDSETLVTYLSRYRVSQNVVVSAATGNLRLQYRGVQKACARTYRRTEWLRNIILLFTVVTECLRSCKEPSAIL